MNIHIETPNFELSPAIATHVRSSLSHCLRDTEDQVLTIDVFLGDINGPRGGEDKKALILVQMVSRLSVRVEAVHSDLYAAVSVASRRAKRKVKSTLRKHYRLNKAEIRRFRQFSGELHAG